MARQNTSTNNTQMEPQPISTGLTYMLNGFRSLSPNVTIHRPLYCSQVLCRVDTSILQCNTRFLKTWAVGIQGTLAACPTDSCGDVQIWKRPLADGELAVAFLKLLDEQGEDSYCVTWEELELPQGQVMQVGRIS